METTIFRGYVSFRKCILDNPPYNFLHSILTWPFLKSKLFTHQLSAADVLANDPMKLVAALVVACLDGFVWGIRITPGCCFVTMDDDQVMASFVSVFASHDFFFNLFFLGR